MFTQYSQYFYSLIYLLTFFVLSGTATFSEVTTTLWK